MRWSTVFKYCLHTGWGTAEMVMTKVLPLWVGARGVEFEWTNLQSALDSNVNLVTTYYSHNYCTYCSVNRMYPQSYNISTIQYSKKSCGHILEL